MTTPHAATAPRPTLISHLMLPRGATRVRAPGRLIALVLGFSALVALSAQIAVFLPFTPVPVSAQTLVVLLTGAVLGSRLGTAALLAYWAEGLAGLPVFAGGLSAWNLTPSGLPWVAAGSAGYAVGFVPAAFLVGWLAERGWDRTVARAAAAMFLGNLVIYAVGLAGLARFVPLQALLPSGLLPFVVGDVLKVGLAAVALPGAWGLLGQRAGRPGDQPSVRPARQDDARRTSGARSGAVEGER